ncbi:type I-F CRISPR-associated endoribonuclease Cas6/Csy4 [Halomonas sp. 1390]|uniref:type I-F CRISPR-associated endoribonuclease Cas6/Csy4 n=1 Tax=Halomonas sp. B23F22_3 TaxID=3459516 RepID=UPI00373EA898
MNRYFFSVRYLVPDADVGLLSGRSMTALHYFVINNHPFDIGVSFPCWSAQSLGDVMDFVCEDKTKLSLFRECGYLSMMKGEGLFDVGDVGMVDDESIDEVRFVRNQGIKKIFPGEMRRRLKRAKKRALERGEAFQPEKLANQREVERFHSSFMESSSTGQSFMLHIQMEAGATYMEKREAGKVFSSYGLATNQVSRGTVPIRALVP